MGVLIEAWGQGMAGRGASLWLAGDGPAGAELGAQGARLGLGDGVRLLGRRDDVPDVLAATDVFVLASRQETTPIALLEAMVAGCACVPTDVGDCRALLADGAAGRIVAQADVPGLAAALREATAAGALRGHLRQAACRRARRFSAVSMS